jgi:hypothetical protein
MKIVPGDKKTYEVRSAGKEGSYEVRLDGAAVGEFVVRDDDVDARLTGDGAGKTTVERIREVAEMFIDRGGLPMKMM